MKASPFSISDAQIDRDRLNDAISICEETITALADGRGHLDGDSVVRIPGCDGESDIMMQRNWQVTDVIRLNIWRFKDRPVVNLAIKGCEGHPLHPDPLREELPQHDRAILETALPYLKDLRSSSDQSMDAIDLRLRAIGALYDWNGMILAPSACGHLSHGRAITAGAAEVTKLDRSETDALWAGTPRICVLRMDAPLNGATGLTLDPYRLLIDRPDPIERMRLISTLPDGATDIQEENPE